jgi:two-component system response regulator VanR
MRVLVVEDEPYMAEAIRDGLRLEAIAADIAGDGATALELLNANSYDIAVLDRDIPGPSGDDVARHIVDSGSGMPILMLTAADRLDDKASGFELGADDYLTKPFSPAELVARIRAMLRRPRSAERREDGPPRRFGDLVLDPLAREVRRDGEPVELTRLEFDLLDALSERPRLAFSRRQLLERVWGPSWFGDEHVVDVHVANLRRKLGDDPRSPRYVRTVRGVGYRMGTGQ